MSFLGGGDASCSTGVNPLSQFSKHVQDDKSLQRDRMVGQGPGSIQDGFRSAAINGPQGNEVCACFGEGHGITCFLCVESN